MVNIEIVEKIRKILKESSEEKNRISGQKFFKESVNLYGVKSADVNKIAKHFISEIRHFDKASIFEISEILFQSGYLEESFIACEFAYSVRKHYSPGDFILFERWITLYVKNWATCDTFCNHSVGELLEKFPELVERLINNWTKSDNRWMRRAAAVSFIVPARNGKFLNEVLRISDILLQDKDDMVQKGIGWLLKVSSSKHLDVIFDYIVKNKSIMSRTSLRYSIEKMPIELKLIAMQKK